MYILASSRNSTVGSRARASLRARDQRLPNRPRTDGDKFAGRHCHRAGRPARKGRRQDLAAAARGGGNSHNQARCRNESVVRAKNRRPQPTRAMDVMNFRARHALSAVKKVKSLGDTTVYCPWPPWWSPKGGWSERATSTPSRHPRDPRLAADWEAVVRMTDRSKSVSWRRVGEQIPTCARLLEVADISGDRGDLLFGQLFGDRAHDRRSARIVRVLPTFLGPGRQLVDDVAIKLAGQARKLV